MHDPARDDVTSRPGKRACLVIFPGQSTRSWASSAATAVARSVTVVPPATALLLRGALEAQEDSETAHCGTQLR